MNFLYFILLSMLYSAVWVVPIAYIFNSKYKYAEFIGFLLFLPFIYFNLWLAIVSPLVFLVFRFFDIKTNNKYILLFFMLIAVCLYTQPALSYAKFKYLCATTDRLTIVADYTIDNNISNEELNKRLKIVSRTDGEEFFKDNIIIKAGIFKEDIFLDDKKIAEHNMVIAYTYNSLDELSDKLILGKILHGYEYCYYDEEIILNTIKARSKK